MNAKDVIVGILFFSVLIALGLLTILLSDFDIFRETYQYDIYFDQANELKIKDNVVIMGSLKGKVTDIKFYEEPIKSDREGFDIDLWIRVKVKMDVKLNLKKDYKIAIRNANLLGGKVLDIRLGKSEEPIDVDNVMLVGMAIRDPIEAISEFVETNKEAVKKTLENVNNLVQNVSDWSDHISEGKGTLGRLIQSETLADDVESALAGVDEFIVDLNNKESILGMMIRDPEAKAKVEAVVDNAVRISDQLALGEGTIGKLIQSSEIHDTFLNITKNIEELTISLKEGKSLAGKILAEESGKTFDAFSGIVTDVKKISSEAANGKGVLPYLFTDENLTAKVKSIVEGIAKSVKNIEQGNGVIGKLINDEALANKVSLIFDEVIGALEDAREAAPLSSLGSFLFGAI